MSNNDARDRIALLRGRARKWTLIHLEKFAYRVAGLPMALRPRRGEATSAAEYLHHRYRTHYWRLPWGPLIGVVAALAWPIALAVTVIQCTSRNGAAIRSRTGKSIAVQVVEQLRAAAGQSIAPIWYYMFELFDDERQGKAGLYLTAHETIAGAYAVLEPRDGSDIMADKVWFAATCREKGVFAVPVILNASKGSIHFQAGEAQTLPEMDLFVKPRVGNGGHNSERWDFVDGGRFRSSRGRIFASGELLQWLSELSLKEDYIVQPRLINHPLLDDISNDALATVRVLTCRNEQGEFEATNTAFRMAIGANSVVDNFHQGGIAAPVEFATGRLGLASDIGKTPDVGWRHSHPVTGAPFLGRVLPYWADVIALACQAHAAFPQRTAVGWDVAMLRDGPCIIEGNASPDLDIHQRAERRPLGDQRIAELLAFNLRNVPG
ncbi:hypothetical protein BH10PSE7_BH10PSE7_13940 [soil metagenome]